MGKIKPQIPTYRANKKDSDERVEGYLIYSGILESYRIIANYKEVDVDSSTLAIHFPDMIDSEGTKIFASLSEDGKGGDIDGTQEEDYVFIMKRGVVGISPIAEVTEDFDDCICLDLCKVTGIQK